MQQNPNPEETELTVENETEDMICSFCGSKDVVWSYMPGEEVACDECVPRGCFCNTYPIDGNLDSNDESNWTQDLDTQGRPLPCCEWWSRNDDTHELTPN